MNALQIKQILCPTDFDDLSTLALEHAVRLAERTGAHLTMLYADRFLPPLEFTAQETDGVARSLDAERSNTLRSLQGYVRDHVPAAIPVEAMVAVDDPASAIAAETARRQVDVVAMGTHGRTGVDRLVVGSVTERVLSETQVPVLAVRRPPEGAAPGAARVARSEPPERR